jgi:hypothetical protein
VFAMERWLTVYRQRISFVLQSVQSVQTKSVHLLLQTLLEGVPDAGRETSILKLHMLENGRICRQGGAWKFCITVTWFFPSPCIPEIDYSGYVNSSSNFTLPQKSVNFEVWIISLCCTYVYFSACRCNYWRSSIHRAVNCVMITAYLCTSICHSWNEFELNRNWKTDTSSSSSPD